MKITSVQNEKVKLLVRLLKKRNRDKENLVLIEGKKEIEMAKESGLEILEHYHLPEEAGMGDKMIIINEEVAKKISVRENPAKNFALVKKPDTKLKDIIIKNDALVLVLEDLEKPGNIGAILRTADASGVDAVIITKPRTDIYNPNVVRTSRGTVFSVPIISGENEAIYKFLKENNFSLVGTSPLGDKKYTEYDYSRKTALLIGTEHEGLSDFWLKQADSLVKIPMLGRIDSLNASVSTAIICFEAVRQKNHNIV
jgi:TrmH family RNA methyltransferase